MDSRKLLWVFGTVVSLQLIPSILSWGQHGHYATCKIAEAYLSEDAVVAVKQLLPKSAGGELAAVCSWPDEIRFHYRWSGPLHYIDTPDFRCQYDYSRDCHDSSGNEGRCVTGAIYNYTQQLVSGYQNNTFKSKYNLTEALMFLAHFIGDVHQPLHVGFTSDEGGNTIRLHWFRQKCNLHHVWDTSIIDTALKRFYSSDLSYMIQAIQRNITDSWSDNLIPWEVCTLNRTACPDPYASESISLACSYAYKNATPGSTLDDGYFLSRLPVVEKRLAQGGIRLAATLNRIFASQPLISIS
ncbi:Endonuclease 4 [Dionaea muscipula]